MPTKRAIIYCSIHIIVSLQLQKAQLIHESQQDDTSIISILIAAFQAHGDGWKSGICRPRLHMTMADSLDLFLPEHQHRGAPS